MIAATTKLCRTCGVAKPLDQMLRHRSSKDGRQHKCIDCSERRLAERRLRNNRDWRVANPEKYAISHARTQRRALASQMPEQRRAKTLRKYGLTQEAYDAMLRGQGGVCAICSREFEDALHVDHDPVSGAVRGLLCGSCNRGIGLLGHDTERLIAAATYLVKSETPVKKGMAL